MDIIRELFVSYRQVNGKRPILKLVADRETLEVIKQGAPLSKQVGSIINVETTNENDPILSIVYLDSRALRPGEPESITQEVVKWLKGIGEWWT